MADPAETPAEAKRRRRRLITLGEVIGISALAISALGLWNSWSRDDRPTVVVEKPRPVPFALRGKITDEGKRMTIAPVDPGHALETLSLTAPGKAAIDLGSDPDLSAASVEGLLPAGKREGNGAISVAVDARFIDGGIERHGGGRYRIAYRWVGGGLFGGHSLRLTALTRG